MTFENAISHILKFEGGYVNDPHDPGGETNFGISKRGHPNEDIKNLTIKRAMEIYRLHYWDKCLCDFLPPGIRLLVFDSAVNQGVFFATQILQAAADVEIDGVIGPKTLAALKTKNEEKLILAYAHGRKNNYFKSPLFARYGSGWIGRLISVLVYTQKEKN